MTQLVELAMKFVSLSGDLDAVRSAMKKLLMNGGGAEPPNPTAPPGQARGARPSKRKRPRPGLRLRSQPHAKGRNTKGRDAKAIAAAKAEEAIVELLRATPGMRTSAIAKVAQAPLTSTAKRLARLEGRALVQRGADEGWRATAPSD
jgi:hypothetical protein